MRPIYQHSNQTPLDQTYKRNRSQSRKDSVRDQNKTTYKVSIEGSKNELDTHETINYPNL